MVDALIIDDNRETADALQQMLELLGIPSHTAYGASPAMAALSSMTPRLVLLDLNLPGINGTEILAFLRRELRLASVPVIVVTSDDQPETRKRLMRGGAAAFILKPVDLSSLEEALRKVGVLS